MNFIKIIMLTKSFGYIRISNTTITFYPQGEEVVIVQRVNDLGEGVIKEKRMRLRRSVTYDL